MKTDLSQVYEDSNVVLEMMDTEIIALATYLDKYLNDQYLQTLGRTESRSDLVETAVAYRHYIGQYLNDIYRPRGGPPSCKCNHFTLEASLIDQQLIGTLIANYDTRRVLHPQLWCAAIFAFYETAVATSGN